MLDFLVNHNLLKYLHTCTHCFSTLEVGADINTASFSFISFFTFLFLEILQCIFTFLHNPFIPDMIANLVVELVVLHVNDCRTVLSDQ